MSNKSSHFYASLLNGKNQTLVVFGTSLSYHVAPILRSDLQALFGELVSVVNSGMAAKASRTALEQLGQRVIRYNPDALLIEFAINDAHDYHHESGALDQGISPQESRANLETIISRVQLEMPAVEIILWTTNNTWDVEGSVMRGRLTRPELELYYQGVREVASARGLRLLDAEKFWNSTHESLGEDFMALIPDGVHPSPKALRGYLAPFLLSELGFPSQPL